jgi:sugar phosphate isomerase/epimerase
MELGLCTISDREASIESVLAHAEQAGYDGVEIWGRDHVGDGSDETCARIVDVATDHGLSILAYGSYLRAGAEDFAAELDHEVMVADRLGADRIRVWAGTVEYGDHDDAHWDQTVSDLRDLTALAVDHGVDVTVEKHPGYLTNDAEGARRLVEAVDDAACRLNYQPMFSLSDAEIREEIELLAPLSNQMHLQAVSKRGADGHDRCALSEAYYDVEFVVEQFRDDGASDGSIHVEFVDEDLPYPEAIAGDRSYLSSLLR